jgi:hypothetical protein
MVAAIVGLWAATIPFAWLRDWASLDPQKIGLATSTYISVSLRCDLLREPDVSTGTRENAPHQIHPSPCSEYQNS